MPDTFQDVVNAAVADMIEHGYDSQERVDRWMAAIRAAAVGSLVPESVLAETLRQSFRASYRRQVEGGELARRNPGIARFTIQNVEPRLRAELDRRIMASAQLIKLNRTEAVEKTLRRFSGWSTSIPAGGTDQADRRAVKNDVKKAMRQLPYVERRVLIDQGHKFVAALSETVAVGGGAIAGVWHSRWRQAGYDYREDHKERDRLVYAVRGNWAIERGLMKAGPAGYTDQITKPGEEVFCRCSYSFLYNLRDLPADMLTVKGRAELARVRVAA